MSTARAVPFYCPYCGEEDLQPLGDRHGAWWCQSCRRAWTLKMLGTGTPDQLLDDHDEKPTSEAD